MPCQRAREQIAWRDGAGGVSGITPCHDLYDLLRPPTTESMTDPLLDDKFAALAPREKEGLIISLEKSCCC